jgi:uncharacterized protein YndB with AHSA1/START domain
MAGDERDETVAAAGDPSPDAPIPDATDASTASEFIVASPAEVFAVLVDPATYPEWLVGARRIRSVDDDWPAPGSSFRHTIGWGPARIPGSTSVRRCVAPLELVLSAGMGPLGEASVRFELEATGDGTLVRLEELPASGPVRVAWRLVGPPVGALLWGRNAVSLGSLARRVEQERSGR